MTENPFVVIAASGTPVVLERQSSYVAVTISGTSVGTVILTLDEARRIGHWLVTEPTPPSVCVHCGDTLAVCLVSACCDDCMYEGRRHSHPVAEPSSGGPNVQR